MSSSKKRRTVARANANFEREQQARLRIEHQNDVLQAIIGTIHKKFTGLIEEMIDIYEEACEHDNAAKGFKHRERVFNRAREAVGREAFPIPESWDE